MKRKTEGNVREEREVQRRKRSDEYNIKRQRKSLTAVN
jgi:hypothetical protein